MPEDLFIGAEFSLFGRPFLVTDADESTKVDGGSLDRSSMTAFFWWATTVVFLPINLTLQAYYKKTYGIEDMTPLVIEEEKAVVYQRVWRIIINSVSDEFLVF